MDESGNYSRGDRYTVAACWCLSEHAPRHVLDGARVNLIQHLQDAYDMGGYDGELKGNHLPNDLLGVALETFEQFVHSDGTVLSSPYPWPESGYPLKLSTDSFQPDSCKRLLSNWMNEVDAPTALQMLSLVSLIDPLYHGNRLDLSDVSSIQLVLDAEVWRSAAEEVTTVLDSPNGVPIDFEIRDSKKTPGIQFADMVAYGLRRSLIGGDSGDVSGFINQRHI